MGRLAAVAGCALYLASAAVAGTTTAHPLLSPPVLQKPHLARLSEGRAIAAFLEVDKVQDWLSRYPRKGRIKQATFSPKYHNWTVKIWWGKAGEIATGRVDDATAVVTESWTGPQVAWKMARGYGGAFGGKEINSLPVWLAFCAAFFVGLADFRRPFSVRNLDLLVLLSFTVSWWLFNRGSVFTSMPLVYPPLLYLLGRMIWIGWHGRAASAASGWPIWVLAGATIFLAGFRVGLNIENSNVIDVGYSGVIGADRIVRGEAPYGHFPVEDKLRACGPADQDGEIRDRVQRNGRCESANPQGDTYGPVVYEAYLPAYAAFGWSGKWDDLPAAHAAAIVFDLLCLLGLALVGLRFGGLPLGAALSFAWVAWPFTQYVSSSNTNDALMPALLIWGFWLITSPAARGVSAALAGWTKFGALLVAPLWLSYPDARRRPRPKLIFGAAFLLTTLAVFSLIFLESSPLHELRVFWDRTVSWQFGRESPFSIWDWRQYHARGLPDLHLVQRVAEVLVGLGAVAAYFVPRRKSPLQLAALTAALLIAFELVLTHWFFLYLPWFFPFVAIVVLVSQPTRIDTEDPDAHDDRDSRELLPAG